MRLGATDLASDAVASCLLPGCGWRVPVHGGNEKARALCVLHTIVRHPDQFARATGRDAETAAHQYRDDLLRFKEWL